MEAVRIGVKNGGCAGMEYTTQLVMIPGTHVSGIDVSVDRRAWQRKRPVVVALGAFPTVNETGVSAGGRRT